ncbi:MAG TPA: hypothetical protein VFF30_12525 [Nitrososphaerales archaeon]|nr:hypothetical protein [Nitrososphaerales archaeon]
MSKTSSDCWKGIFSLGDCCDYCAAFREEFSHSQEISKLDMKEYAKHLYDCHLQGGLFRRPR